MLAVLAAIAVAMVPWAPWLKGGPVGYSRAALNPHDPSLTLARAQELIARHYRVRQTPPESVAAKAAAGRVALFDVRTAEEFQSGHIAGAVHVEPGMSGEDFFARHGHLLTDRPAVFYCSVGYRSSKLVERLLAHVKTSQSIGTFNLSGGAFRWVYEGRDLVSGDAPGELHPYSAEWAGFLDRLMATRTAVR